MDRRTDIDRAKGFAIVLVVFGHIAARHVPAGVLWYPPLHRAIYAFHMPFFFYLSGMVSWLAGHATTPPEGWPALAAARARRLLVPFALMGGLIVLGKIVVARFMIVDNPPTGLVSGLIDLVWTPGHSPAYSLWYLFVLFVLSLLAPALLHALRGRVVLLLPAFAALEFIPLPWTLYLAVIARYGLFYALGLCAGALGESWIGWIDRRCWPLLAVFCAGFVLIAAFGAHFPFAVRLLTLGPIAMPALHALLRFPCLSSDRILMALGRYSLMIYLFNTIFIGLAKGVLLSFAAWSNRDFIPLAAILMASGLFGPILLKCTLFRAIPVLDRMTR
ncbi:MAG TPA: acyltransferase [Acidiphilium sp.]